MSVRVNCSCLSRQTNKGADMAATQTDVDTEIAVNLREVAAWAGRMMFRTCRLTFAPDMRGYTVGVWVQRDRVEFKVRWIHNGKVEEAYFSPAEIVFAPEPDNV